MSDYVTAVYVWASIATIGGLVPAIALVAREATDLLKTHEGHTEGS